MAVDPRTIEMIAGTAILLLDRCCPDQKKGSRVLVGDSNYTIVEHGKNLDIHFRGDGMRPPTTVLQLRSILQNDTMIPHITSDLSSQDVERFTRINQELTRDNARSQSAAVVLPQTPNQDLDLG